MVKLYVEGGGSSRKEQIECRRAFSQLLEKAGFTGRMPRIVACGSRSRAWQDFLHAVAQPDETAMLLLDSEEPVHDRSVWAHLHIHDGFARPAQVQDIQVQLMVTCMETWLICDREALHRFFGAQFNAGALPSLHNIESRSRHEVIQALKQATRQCPKNYAKGDIAFKALAQVDPTLLRRYLPHFVAFVAALETLIPGH